jgi:hypothetical protein
MDVLVQELVCIWLSFTAACFSDGECDRPQLSYFDRLTSVALHS